MTEELGADPPVLEAGPAARPHLSVALLVQGGPVVGQEGEMAGGGRVGQTPGRAGVEEVRQLGSATLRLSEA